MGESGKRSPPAVCLSARGLACERGGRQVFAGLSLEAAAGEALLVTGRNGAGKSSLLRLLAGLLQPAAGMLRLEGGDPERSLAEQSHFLGHLDPVKPALTVAENLAFWVSFLGGAGDGRAFLAAAGLGTLGDLPAGYLSAGQRRRLSLARLVAVTRPVWLLDEPTSALDSAGQTIFAGLAQGHLAAGGIIVAATHTPLGLERTRELRLGAGA